MAIRKLLVANRGEIALRVFRACRELGIGTVAVGAAGRQRRAARPFRRRDGRDHLVSRVRGAHSRSQASRAPTRSTPATASWRRTPTSHAPSRLPGSSGSGPRPRHSRSRGDKLRSKQVAREAGVPVVESGEPAELGFPLILKAAAGGGGRGMRVVRSADELEEARAAASREAHAAFGDGTVFAERYVERPRHIEIQLLGDVHGTVVVARRARVLDPATPPEGPRGSAVARARPRAPRADRRGGCCVRESHRLPRRGHRRVHGVGPRVLVPRAERTNPGRASRDRARHRRGPRQAAATDRAGRGAGGK